MNPVVYQLIIQAIGFIGIACSVISVQCRRHQWVMIWKTANEMFFALQYVLLGAYTGVAMNLVGSARNMLFAGMVAKGKSTRVMQIFFSVLFVVFGLFTWQGPISVLIMAAKILTTVAFGIKNTAHLRLLTLPSSVCWLIYNVGSGSIAGIVCEIMAFTSIVTAMIRIDIYGARKANKERKDAEEKA